MQPTPGLDGFPQIMTEDDVLSHYYKPGPVPEGAAADVRDRVMPGPAGSEELSDADLALKLESDNSKPSLVTMAEAAGVDTSGTKRELSERLVAHYRAK
jgi:hypothetical protein